MLLVLCMVSIEFDDLLKRSGAGSGQMWLNVTKTATMGNDLSSQRSSLPTPDPLISSYIALFVVFLFLFISYLYLYF